MNVQIITLCDAANTDSGGKLNILGAFDQIFAQKEPLMHPSCCLVVKIRFDKIEEGTKTIKIMFVDHDGKQVFPPIEGNVEVKIPDDHGSGTVQLVVIVQQLQLPHFGEYQIDVALDGLVVGSIPLFARPFPK
jgi:hypothetical protein